MPAFRDELVLRKSSAFRCIAHYFSDRLLVALRAVGADAVKKMTFLCTTHGFDARTPWLLKKRRHAAGVQSLKFRFRVFEFRYDQGIACARR